MLKIIKNHVFTFVRETDILIDMKLLQSVTERSTLLLFTDKNVKSNFHANADNILTRIKLKMNGQF